MSSPNKKRKTTKKPSPAPTPIPSLPDDLLLSCFARVSRLYHPTLSLVSKSFRSFLASSEVYKTRLLLGRTESCLYVCLHFHPDPNPRWFTLCRKPYQTLTNSNTNNSSENYVLAPISIPDSPQTHKEGLVAVGSNIYAIGEPKSSSSVLILDCQSHTWHEAPNMWVKRSYPTANVFDGKIYVAGGCEGCGECNFSNWMEVFNTKTQTWEPVLSPSAEIYAEACGCRISKTAMIEGEIFMVGKRKCVSYKPNEDRWRRGMKVMNVPSTWISFCVIDNILYSFTKMFGFIWYDFKVECWRHLAFLEALPNVNVNGLVKVADYGGKMAVFWDKDVPTSSGGYENKVICCAVIALEKRNNEEIWGKVEWCDNVFTVPTRSYQFVHALAVTV